jgi:hypothetical protein
METQHLLMDLGHAEGDAEEDPHGGKHHRAVDVCEARLKHVHHVKHFLRLLP